MIVKERGSSGSKGMSIRMGIVDSGYRNEIFIGINNTSDRDILIRKETDDNRGKKKFKTTVYPYSKAIAQVLILPVPKMNVKEISYNKLLKIESNRGTGKLGSTGK